jgi:hypothetical protein
MNSFLCIFIVFLFRKFFLSYSNENPTHLIYRVIEKGFTKDISGTVVPYEYITSFTYNGKGQVLSINGPLPGNGDSTSFAYNATTGDLLSITRSIIGSTNFSNYDAAGQVGHEKGSSPFLTFLDGNYT